MILYVGVAIEGLRISRAHAGPKRIRTRESPEQVRMVARLREIQSCFAIALISSELLANGAAGVAEPSRATARTGIQLLANGK